MHGSTSRWPSATAISIALHALIVFALAWGSPGSARVIVWLDEFEGGRTGPRFEPGAVVPIELADRERSDAETETQAEEHAEVPELPRSGGRKSEPPSFGPVPVAQELEPHEGLAAASSHEGLLGRGRERHVVDPDLLRGSRALYAGSASIGRVEGPQRFAPYD